MPTVERRLVARKFDHRIARPARPLGIFEFAAPHDEARTVLPEGLGVGRDIRLVFFHIVDVDAHDPVTVGHGVLQFKPSRPSFRRRRVTKRALKPADIVPLAELAANVPEDADGLEADATAQRDAALAGQRDAGVCVAVTLAGQVVEELEIERATDALTPEVRADIGGNLHRPAVGRALAMRRPVGVARALPVANRDKPLPPTERLGNALSELLDRRDDRFERHGGRPGKGAVDGEKAGRGGFGGGTDQRLGHRDVLMYQTMIAMALGPSARSGAPGLMAEALLPVTDFRPVRLVVPAHERGHVP